MADDVGHALNATARPRRASVTLSPVSELPGVSGFLRLEEAPVSLVRTRSWRARSSRTMAPRISAAE